MQQLNVKPGCAGCLWRQNRPRLCHFVVRAQGSGAEDKRDAIAERIAKARQYREPANNKTQALTREGSPTQPQQKQSAEDRTSASEKLLAYGDASEKLLAYGDSQARQQEQQLLAAVQEIKKSPAPSNTSEDLPPSGPHSAAQPLGAQAQASAPAHAQAQPAKTLSKEDMLAKVSQAKAYKQEKQAKGGGVPEIVPVNDTKSESAPAQDQASPPDRKHSFSASQRRTAPDVADGGQADGPEVQPQAENDGTGSATQAAGFLQQGVKGKDASKGMRLETYSMLKEQEMKNQKVEIISIDKSYSTDKKVMDPNYSPKVSTWGVFERPANISEAYGGGRTIRAGTPLEDPAATQARKERIATALSRFKRDAGTQVDPAVQQACEESFAEGERLFKDKLVAAALTKYAAAAELMPIKTSLGGRARLQKAICLDSLGQNKEAYAVYCQIERHPNGDVAKQAKRMIFGFRAMDNLKAHTMSYSVTKGAYDKYFNSLSGDWNAAYVSNEEDTTELNKVIILASAVMLSPLVFLAIKILSNR